MPDSEVLVPAAGKSQQNEFEEDSKHWLRVVEHLYLNGLNLDWATIRNVLDASAHYGGCVTPPPHPYLPATSDRLCVGGVPGWRLR